MVALGALVENGGAQGHAMALEAVGECRGAMVACLSSSKESMKAVAKEGSMAEMEEFRGGERKTAC